MCKDIDEMLNTLKDKIKISYRRRSIQLLILVPSSWSIEKTQDFFGVNGERIEKIETWGLNRTNTAKSARYISDTTVEIIQIFYKSD